MKCPDCSYENRPEARFCKQCGTALPQHGQPLQAEGPSPTPMSPVCPACGATAKPGGRFCPRCGKPLAVKPEPQPPSPAQPPSAAATTEPGMPVPQPYATPPYSPPPAQPAAYAQPPSRPLPSPKPSVPKQGQPRSLWVVGSIAAFLCIAALVVAIVVLRPKLFGAEEEPTPTPVPTQPPTIEATLTAAQPNRPPATETPTVAPTAEPAPATETPTVALTAEPAPAEAPVFGAQLTISSSSTDLQVGELLTITADVVNIGDVTFGNLRYQLLGNWEPHLSMITDEVVEHESDVVPGQSDASTFMLHATQPGTAVLRANVTVKTREDPPTVKPVPSESVLEISVAQ